MDHEQGPGEAAGAWYTTTPYARSFLNYGLSLTNPTPILSFRRKGVPLDKQTGVELIQLLERKGWTDCTTTKKKNAAPFTLGAEKIWWKKPCQSLSLTYLRALASAEDRLKSGSLQRIHHFQPKAYYSAVLQGCNPLPNQPLVYYKQIMNKKNHKGKGSKRAKKLTRHQDTGIEDEPCSLVNVQSLFVCLSCLVRVMLLSLSCYCQFFFSQ